VILQALIEPAEMNKSMGRIIILNGTSSSGKSTLAAALRPALEPQFHYYASDQLAGAGFRPLDDKVRFAWRTAFFHGFHRSIAAFAEAGLDLLVEHIVEEAGWGEDLAVLLKPFDVFWVGVHAPAAELARREQLRGDRQIGEALQHLATHTYCRYDIEVDTIEPVERNVEAIVHAWNGRHARSS
jgi:chloramphenicol 3-O phosphotransferase